MEMVVAIIEAMALYPSGVIGRIFLGNKYR